MDRFILKLNYRSNGRCRTQGPRFLDSESFYASPKIPCAEQGLVLVLQSPESVSRLLLTPTSCLYSLSASIRAYGVQEAFTVDSLRRIDKYTRAARIYFNLNRWISVRIDILGSLLAAGLAVYLVYFRGHTASDTGFSLNMTGDIYLLCFLWRVTQNVLSSRF